MEVAESNTKEFESESGNLLTYLYLGFTKEGLFDVTDADFGCNYRFLV